MVSHLLTCPNGHQWRPSDAVQSGTSLCPVCGAEVALQAPADDPSVSDDTLRAATGDSTSPGPHADTSHDSLTPKPTPLAQPDHDTFPGYELRGELGRGGMGVVYRAYDQKHHRDVALKTLKHDDPQALERFKQEFRTISGIVHPNLASIYELISDGHVWFLTMELVEDVLEFQNYVHEGFGAVDADNSADDMTIVLDRPPRSSGRVSAEQINRLRTALTGLASGVAALHGASVLHRDIKPSNVVVNHKGRVVLLDFGLAATLDRSGSHQASENRVLGTAAYMAPEQAAGETVSQASDWYAVGVMMYQGLTGRLPVEGRPMQIMMLKQTAQPTPPTDLVSGVPGDLNNLCMALLAISPEERPSAADILRVLSATDDPAPVMAPAPSEPRAVTQLVGRDDQLQQLRDALTAMKSGESLSVFVNGRSGGGKSTLVERFLDEVGQESGTLVLRGRCYEQESVPFKALDSLIDSLCRYLRRLNQADTMALMPRDAALLPKVFPVLAQIPEFARAPRRESDIPDQLELRRRANVALRELLQRLGDRSPLVLYIDDLQWGDVDSATLLTDLLQPPDPPVLLFVGTYRSEDEDTSPFLRRQREIRNQRVQSATFQQIPVEPLHRDEVVRLVTGILGREDEDAVAAAQAIADETDGNPFFATEMARYAHPGGQSLRPNTSAQTLTLDDVLWSRVEAFPDQSRKLLEVVAVAGKPISVEAASQAADLDSEATAALARLRTNHMVRTAGADDESRVETFHDRVRESVVAHLSDDRRSNHHVAIARTYEHASGLDAEAVSGIDADQFAELPHEHRQTVYDLAYHYDAAGDHERALLFAVPAALHAKSQFSLEIAEQQFRIAERGAADAEDELQFQIAEGFGEVLMLRGLYEEAAPRFATAEKLATSQYAQAEIESRIGELAFKQGDMAHCVASMQRALKLLGRPAPNGIVPITARLLSELARQVLHTCCPGVFVGRKSAGNMREIQLTVHLYNRLSYGFWFTRGSVPTLWAHLQGMNLAECYPPTLELAHAYSIHAPVMTLIPLYERGLEFVNRSYEIRRNAGDVQGQGQSLHFRGVVFYGASRFEECIETCRESIGLLEQTGDWWEVNMCRYQLAGALYRLGRLPEAVAEAQRMHRSGLELGDAQASGIILDVWAMATNGRVPQESIAVEVARERHDAQATAQVLLAAGIRLIHEQRLEAAEQTLLRGWNTARKAGVKNTYVLTGLIWMVTAVRLQAEQLRESAPAECRKLVAKARRLLSKGLRMARGFRNDMPHALREAAILAAMCGRGSRSKRFFDEALRVADQQKAVYEAARTRLARARLAGSMGWSEWSGDVEQAEAEVSRFEDSVAE